LNVIVYSGPAKNDYHWQTFQTKPPYMGTVSLIEDRAK